MFEWCARNGGWAEPWLQQQALWEVHGPLGLARRADQDAKRRGVGWICVLMVP